MPKVHFDKNFDFSPPERKGMVTIAYKSGTERNVTRACAKAAVDGGFAKYVDEKKIDDSEQSR